MVYQTHQIIQQGAKLLLRVVLGDSILQCNTLKCLTSDQVDNSINYIRVKKSDVSGLYSCDSAIHQSWLCTFL